MEFKAPFSDGENESVVIGQPTFTTESSPDATANSTILNSPSGLAFDPSGNLWVSDDGWDRVLEFKAPLTTYEAASTVIGQTNFTSGVQDIPGCPQNCAALTSPNSLNDPRAITFDSSGNLWVADSHGGRVLKFNAPVSTGESASVALGVPDLNHLAAFGCVEGGPNCISLPDSLAFDKSGNLWVSDDPAGRVLEYTSPQSTAENASLAIGQPNTTIINGAGIFNVTQSDMIGNDGVVIDPFWKPMGE